VVLNIWGSWCSPCRAEAKNLVTVADDTKAKGVQFVGINTRDLQTAQAKAFEKKYAVSYPSLYDPTGKLILRFPKGSLNPQAIPTTIVLDRQGRIAVRALKALTEDELRKILDPLIAEK
jgi:thiol-disulfide isomerase/thioredoxin